MTDSYYVSSRGPQAAERFAQLIRPAPMQQFPSQVLGNLLGRRQQAQRFHPDKLSDSENGSQGKICWIGCCIVASTAGSGTPPGTLFVRVVAARN